jgi:hypothetical protein
MSTQRAVRSVIAVFVLVVAGACSGASQTTQATSSTGGWISFHGNWTATGKRTSIRLGPDRNASIADFEGTLYLTGTSHLVGFRANAIVLNDTSTGAVGRAVWTDDRGDQIFSELRGGDTAAGKKVDGTFIGGTGRYTGASGSYEFTWKFVIDSDDGQVQGESDDLTGRVRVENQS